MADECLRLKPLATRNDCFLNPYALTDDLSAPQGHPRRRSFPACGKTLPNDLIPMSTKIKQVYHCDELRDFIRQALSLENLYRYKDEYQSLNISYIGNGDQLGWHYDFNDFVVSLLLQKADQGGEFEYAPNIRDTKTGEENYDDVARLYEGSFESVVVSQSAGTLALFQGIESAHRVRCVYGSKERITSLLAYNKEPGFIAPDIANICFYGDRVKKKIYKERNFIQRLKTNYCLKQLRKGK